MKYSWKGRKTQIKKKKIKYDSQGTGPVFNTYHGQIHHTKALNKNPGPNYEVSSICNVQKNPKDVNIKACYQQIVFCVISKFCSIYWFNAQHAGKKNQQKTFWNVLFFPENRLWYFMSIVSYGDNLHELSNLIFWKNLEKNKMSSAEILPNVLRVKYRSLPDKSITDMGAGDTYLNLVAINC